MTEPALCTATECAGKTSYAIDLAVRPEAAGLMPVIDDVICYQAPWMNNNGSIDPAADWSLLHTLRERQFDAAVIFTVSSMALPAALTCYLAEIPLRAAHCRENPYHLLTHWVPDREPEQGIRHEVQRQLDLVATMVAPTKTPPCGYPFVMPT